MKAITTEAYGYRFRSRTEARWAVFFKGIGVNFVYEKEGFELPNGRYLPDFWLEKEQMWAEVKGEKFTLQELHKAHDLANATQFPVLLLSGVPARKVYFAIEPTRGFGWKLSDGTPVKICDYTLYVYPRYDHFYAVSGHTDIEKHFPEPFMDEDHGGYDASSIKKALSARFEHGEFPV